MAKPVPGSPYTAGKPDDDVGPVKEDQLSTADLDTLRQAVSELMADRARDREALARQRQELEETQQLVQRLMHDGKGLNEAVLAARLKDREEARQRIYRMIREGGGKVTILLPKDQNPNRNFALHVAVNGNVVMIPRGQPFELDVAYLEALDHAMVSTLTREVDQFGNPQVTMHDYLSYPYQMLRGFEGIDSGDLVAAQPS